MSAERYPQQSWIANPGTRYRNDSSGIQAAGGKQAANSDDVLIIQMPYDPFMTDGGQEMHVSPDQAGRVGTGKVCCFDALYCVFEDRIAGRRANEDLAFRERADDVHAITKRRGVGRNDEIGIGGQRIGINGGHKYRRRL